MLGLEKTYLIIGLGITLSFFLSLLGCTQKKQSQHFSPLTPLPFEKAISVMSQHLFIDINADRSLQQRFQQTRVLLEPFVDAYSKEQIASSQRINHIIRKTGEQYPTIIVLPLQRNTLPIGEYAIHGQIYLYRYAQDKNPQHKRYRINAVARHISSGRIVSSGDVWIQEKNLNYTPTPEYRDNPVYDVKRNTKRNINPLENLNTAKLPQTYRQELGMSALLNEAGKTYAQGQYDKALELYAQAAQNMQDHRIRTFAGLYMTQLKLGRVEQAEYAFEQLVRLSLAQSNGLNVKILFKVNSTEFWGDEHIKQQYMIWIKVIGRIFSQDDNKFLRIIGHSSRTGTKAWNDELSLRRAKTIQSLLTPYFPEVMRRSQAVGKGFRENIVGIGTDDERDALDRRVEFSIIRAEKPF